MPRRLFNKIVKSLMAVLGFAAHTSCGVEYGTPYADYKIRGTAIDGQTAQPVEGIRVVFHDDSLYEDPKGRPRFRYADTVYTGADGSFDAKLKGLSWPDLYLLVEDVDGEENGSYGTFEFQVDMNGAKRKKGKGEWYEGVYSKDIGNISMKKALPEKAE